MIKQSNISRENILDKIFFVFSIAGKQTILNFCNRYRNISLFFFFLFKLCLLHETTSANDDTDGSKRNSSSNNFNIQQNLQAFQINIQNSMNYLNEMTTAAWIRITWYLKPKSNNFDDWRSGKKCWVWCRHFRMNLKCNAWSGARAKSKNRVTTSGKVMNNISFSFFRKYIACPRIPKLILFCSLKFLYIEKV